MKPLRIEFDLKAPVSGMALPVHLDALIAYAVTQQKLAEGHVPHDNASIRDLAKELPFEKAFKDDDWCWMASALMPEAILMHEMRMWTRKLDTDYIANGIATGKMEMARKAKFPLKPHSMRLDTASGLMKNHFQHMPVRHVHKFIAYCIGDQDAIQDLLQLHIHHIGARGRIGLGNILQDESGTIKMIHVIEDDAALDKWQLRVMPWELEGYIPMEAACKIPYWAKENLRISYVPQEILM